MGQQDGWSNIIYPGTKMLTRFSGIVDRVIFMENHIPIRPDRSLQLGRQTSKWSLWAVGFDENNSRFSVGCFRFTHLKPATSNQ